MSEDVKKSLDKVLPERWSNANPVDILGDADGERYAQACECVLGDTANNALLIMNAPNTLASPIEMRQVRRRCGEETPNRDLLAQAGLHGMGRRRRRRRQRSSVKPVFRTSPAKRTPFAASCTSCATVKVSTSRCRRRPACRKISRRT